jgi:glycosyltransferase involved in cell wall biosynthesis
MEIARVMAKLEPGGAQIGALRLTTALARLGIRSRWLAGDATPDGLALAAAHGVEVETLGWGRGLQWEPSPEFAAWLGPRLEGADLVHAHMFGGWWATAQAIAPGVPLVASEHNALSWPGPPRHDAFAEAAARVDAFLAHGAAARAYALAHGMAPERVHRGCSPVTGMGAAPRPRLPPRRIVYAGRFVPDKGPDVLVEALALLRDPAPAYLLGSGELEPALRARIDELGVEAHLPGWVDDPAPWIAGAAAVAVPSRAEAMSQVAVLGLGLGTPVVGAAVEGLPEVLGGGRGILVAPDDPAALAAALDAVLAGARPDPRPGADFARGFSSGAVARRYAAVYRGIGAPRVAGS